MDYVTRKQSLSLEVNEDARDAFQELKDCEKLVIQIKKYRKKRSLDANAYYWVLITKLARRLELSNPETLIAVDTADPYSMDGYSGTDSLVRNKDFN